MHEHRDARRPTNDPLFNLGRLVATPAALAALEERGRSPLEFVGRHVRGDWGDVDAEDARDNEVALVTGGRLFSSYQIGEEARLWVITEWDRSSTTVLLPQDY